MFVLLRQSAADVRAVSARPIRVETVPVEPKGCTQPGRLYPARKAVPSLTDRRPTPTTCLCRWTPGGCTHPHRMLFRRDLGRLRLSTGGRRYERTAAYPSTASNSAIAAPLSRGSLLLPHRGLWMQEGHPEEQGQVRMASRVAAHHSSRTSKPRSERPTPPG